MVLPAAVAASLQITNFLVWGHWPICAKLARCPVQPFGVLMVFVQTLAAWIACCVRGEAFFAALREDSAHPLAVLSVVGGGIALAIGDFSAAAAIERLGVAVGGPVCFSCMLACGAIGDFILEGSAKPSLLWCGIAMCLFAVLADSQSHPEREIDAESDRTTLAKADSAVEMHSVAEQQQETVDIVVAPTPATTESVAVEPPSPGTIERARKRGRGEFAKGMTVAIVGGIIGGLWTVLSTLGSHGHPLDPLVLLFYFHLGELLFIVPTVLAYGGLFGGATTLKALFTMLRSLSRRQILWTSAAGLCIAAGYLCYFATRGTIPRPVAYAFGCAAGSTGMVYGLCCFQEYKGAPRHKKGLLLCALALYPSAIALIASSMG